MRKLKVETFKSDVLAQSVQIPLIVVKILAKLAPKKLTTIFQGHDAQLEQFIHAINSNKTMGIIFDENDSVKKERIVISIVET